MWIDVASVPFFLTRKPWDLYSTICKHQLIYLSNLIKIISELFLTRIDFFVELSHLYPSRLSILVLADDLSSTLRGLSCCPSSFATAALSIATFPLLSGRTGMTAKTTKWTKQWKSGKSDKLSWDKKGTVDIGLKAKSFIEPNSSPHSLNRTF